jgi:hypothetical protein
LNSLTPPIAGPAGGEPSTLIERIPGGYSPASSLIPGLVGAAFVVYNDRMKSLYYSLVDYELGLLAAIAQRRAVPLPTTNQREAVKQLAEALLSPVELAITLDHLPGPEQTALQFLLAQGGQVDGPRFARQFGVIRPMGPARLDRERPWEEPANPAEGLWYRGLIFKAFQVNAGGGQELVYIPVDILPLLPATLNYEAAPPKFQVATVSPPAFATENLTRLRENFFCLLVFLQLNPVRLTPPGSLSTKDRQQLLQQLLPPLPTMSPAAELEFLLHLGQRAEILILAHDRLRPNRGPLRYWLQAEAGPQSLTLQNSWRADPTWNDLWHVPGLVPQPTGWENSPLRARSKILDYLEQLDAPAGAWLSIDSFVAAIKQIDPDFQRPNGDYESWYIKDRAGQLLMGFDRWDQVEGDLIRYLLTHLLAALSVVDLGSAAEAAAPTCFRLTESGLHFLREEAPPAASPPDDCPLWFRVDEKYQVRVPLQAKLYDRFQLARFALLERREHNRMMYKITQDSVSRAVQNGVTAEQILAFLTRVTNNQLPLKVMESIRTWEARYSGAKLEQVTLLRLKDEAIVAEIYRHPELRSLLGETLNPTTIIVPAKNTARVRQLLIELGYLPPHNGF